MKRILPCILALSMLAQSIGSLWIATAFFFNRSYIAKNQCEKRFQPNSPCQGQCVLMKRLKAHQEQEGQRKELQVKEPILFSGARIVHELAKPLPDFEWTYGCCAWVDLGYAHIHLDRIFHPPLA